MRKKLKDLLVRFRDLVVEYGVVALVVHYIIFAVVIVSAWMALRSGWTPTTAAAKAGSWGAAYVVAKLTQPVRIAITLVLTPVVARWYEHRIEPLLARAGIRTAPQRKDERQ